MELTLPTKLNLFEVVTIQPYYGSSEYNEAYRKFHRNVKIKKTIKLTVNLIFWGALAAFLAHLYFTGHTFLVWVAGIIGVIICGIISSANSPGAVNSYFDTTKKNEEICKKIIDELIQTNFPESRYIHAWGNALIYNNDVFAYISVVEGVLVIYKHDNFRQITWEEVNGTHNYGDLYNYTIPEHGNIGTIAYMGKGYKKEILIEINTNYMLYPVIKFTVPDTPQHREEIKIAASVMS
jgi:hypothetical protein